MRPIDRTRGQTTVEFGILLFVVVAVLIGMQVYVKRNLQGRLKMGADNLGSQHDPDSINANYTVTRQVNVLTTSTTGTMPIHGVDRTVTSSTAKTFWDRTSRSGNETLDDY